MRIMERERCSLTRTSIFSICLVTASFWVLYLLTCAMDDALRNVRNKDPHSNVLATLHRAAAAPADSSPSQSQTQSRDSAASTRSRRSRAGPGEGGTWTWETSPYNARNKPGSLNAGFPPSTSKSKVILWQASKTLRILSSSADMFRGCPVNACHVYPNTNFLAQADAIVFDNGVISRRTPPQSREGRMLVYYNMRPPLPYQAYAQTEDELFLQYWKSAINWIWSYRLDSDIFEPFSYVKPRDRQIKMGAVNEAVRKKTKLAAFISPKVSKRKDGLEYLDKNFHTGHSQTDVEGFLKEFQQVAEVDFLDILELADGFASPTSRKPLALSKYYFLLSLEWVDCTDYVSDLFFYAFDPRMPVVPVVRGGGVSYGQHFPPDVFVRADDFPSPAALARHLQSLAADTKVYASLLWRKSQLVREPGLGHAWCQLCHMLHRADQGGPGLRPRYDDLYAWLNEGGGCLVSNATGTDEDEGGIEGKGGEIEDKS